MANPNGGLARRAGYIQQHERATGQPSLQVDLGNYLLPSGPTADRVNDLMMDSLTRLPVAILNLGSRDLFAWEELVERGISALTVSSNLRPTTPLTEAPATFKLWQRGEIKVLFLGVTFPRLVRANSGFEATDPRIALKELRPLLPDSNLVILLADLPHQAAVQVAMAHPWIDVILRAERHFMVAGPERVNGVIIQNGVERGRYLGRLDARFDEQGEILGLETDLIELSADVPEDPFWRKLEIELSEAAP